MSHDNFFQPFTSHPITEPLIGEACIPGDKSISHRSLILGALSIGTTNIEGLLEGADILATAKIMQQLGADITHLGQGKWQVKGRGTSGFISPDEALDFGNSGTGARLIMGAIVGCPIIAKCIGDASLSIRPMQRVITPLTQMGAKFESSEGGMLPITIKSPQRALPIRYVLPVASAQVKSAILLAGLGTAGITTVIEPHATRSHTERMLRLFGADIRTEQTEEGNVIHLKGEPELVGTDIQVPADPSSSAFTIAAAILVPESDITLRNILSCPHRDGLWHVLRDMGANIEFLNLRQVSGEDLVDLRIRYAPLKGVSVPASRVASMIDEYPILACIAAYAEGETHLHGLAELRVKESDRLATTAAGLIANGVTLKETEDELVIQGGNGVVKGGGFVKTHMDHRIAMSFLILGLQAQNPIHIDDMRMIETSFPSFFDVMAGLGARFKEYIK